jgi:hypothetical protein
MRPLFDYSEFANNDYNKKGCLMYSYRHRITLAWILYRE